MYYKPMQVGVRYYKLTTHHEEWSEPNKHNKRRKLWVMVCDCGKMVRLLPQNVAGRGGTAKSCGCVGRYHNMSHTMTYKSWNSMKARCMCVGATGYKNYGGRGIKVCKRWMSFRNFLKDMGEMPVGFSIERKDNNKGYNKKNCMWIPRNQQYLNRRSNVVINHNGRNVIAAHLARILNVEYNTLLHRHRSGLDLSSGNKKELQCKNI